MERKIEGMVKPEPGREVKIATVAQASVATNVHVRLDAIPDESSRLLFVCAFLNKREIRRLLTKQQAEDLCEEIGIEPSGNERQDCANIHAYFQGDRK